MEDAQSNLGGVSWFFPMYKGEHNNFKKEQYGGQTKKTNS